MTVAAYIVLGLLATIVVLIAWSIWLALGAWRSSEATRKELRFANQHLRTELRAARLQLSNIIQLLLAAGFKKKRVGWEDDTDATQVREESKEFSWWRPKQ